MSIQNVKVDDYEKSTTAYFKSIRNNKPLTKKEEQMLWKRYHEKKDTNARNLLIQANLKFVPTIAKQFKGCGLPFAEIIQEGNIDHFILGVNSTVRRLKPGDPDDSVPITNNRYKISNQWGYIPIVIDLL